MDATVSLALMEEHVKILLEATSAHAHMDILASSAKVFCFDMKFSIVLMLSIKAACIIFCKNKHF